MYDIQTIGVIGGLVVSVFGILILVWQINQLNRSIRTTSTQALYTRAQEIQKILFEHPGLVPCFFEGAHPNAEESGKATLLAEMYLDVFEQILLERGNCPKKISEAWLRYMKFIYRNSPIARQRLRLLGESWIPELTSILESDYRDYATQQRPTLRDVAVGSITSSPGETNSPD